MTLAVAELPPALAGSARPAGDADALRVLASRLSDAAQRYDEAARRLAARTGGLDEAWCGDAAVAGSAALDDLCVRAVAAAGAHRGAADVLLVCAARLGDAQSTWQRAEALERQDAMERAARASAAARGELVSPYEVDGTPLRRQARALAGMAQSEADDALARAQAQLQELADRAPVHESRGLSAREQLVGFGRGAVDAVWGSVVTAAGLSLPRMLADRDGWREQVRGIRDGAAYALDNPRAAGKAAIGWDLLGEGRYGEWSGSLVPDLLSGAFSGGALPMARRGADLADDLGDLAEDVDDLQRVHRRGVPDAGGPVQPQPGAVMAAAYPRIIRDLTPERRQHILDGDPDNPRSGGHRAGAGRDKSEFPASWSDDDIIRRVMDTAMRPDHTVDQRPDRKNLTAYAEHDGVIIQVVVDTEGGVVTAYPVRRRRFIDRPANGERP